MDFLDLHSDFGNPHAISYELPRFCNVKSTDFSYVSGIDCVYGTMNYGVIPVSASYSLRVLFFCIFKYYFIVYLYLCSFVTCLGHHMLLHMLLLLLHLIRTLMVLLKIQLLIRILLLMTLMVLGLKILL